MFTVLKILSISLLSAVWVYAEYETQLPNTMRAGSSGSAGTTQQGPPYDAGIRGPNAAMGAPDTTAVDKESAGAITKKKSVGTIRLDADPGITPTPSPSPTMSPRTF